jgi:hypothetical protein
MGATAETTKRKKAALIKAYIKDPALTHICDKVGITRTTHYQWLKDDPAYAAEFERAKERAVESMEEEARRRAVAGVDEPVYYQGEVCGAIRKYSDTLLIFMLKAARPKVYRERFEHSGPDGGPIQVDGAMRVEFVDAPNREE